jgi:MFS family permease
MQTYIRLLRNNPAYARLWWAMSISFIGDWFNTIVLASLVARLTNGSGLAISLFLLARFLPPLLVTPLAGALADRFDRKRLLIYSDLLRVFVVMGYLLVQTPDQLWLLYVLSILQFCLGAVFEPTRSAYTPALLHKKDLVTANVLGSNTWSLTLALGSAAGGFVTGQFGVEVALLVDAFSFLVSAILIAGIIQRADIEETRNTSGGGFKLSDIADGIRYAKARPEIAAILLVKAGGTLGNVDTLLIIYGTVLFAIGQNGAISLGILWSAYGVGAIIGLLLIDRLNDGSTQRMRALITLAYGCITIGWFIFGAANALWLVVVAMLVKSMGSNTYWTYSSVILQKTVEDRYLGRMFSLDFAGFQLSTGLSTVVTGLILEAVGNQHAPTIVLWTGVVSLIPLAGWWVANRWLDGKVQPTIAAETSGSD